MPYQIIEPIQQIIIIIEPIQQYKEIPRKQKLLTEEVDEYEIRSYCSFEAYKLI